MTGRPGRRAYPTAPYLQTPAATGLQQQQQQQGASPSYMNAPAGYSPQVYQQGAIQDPGMQQPYPNGPTMQPQQPYVSPQGAYPGQYEPVMHQTAPNQEYQKPAPNQYPYYNQQPVNPSVNPPATDQLASGMAGLGLNAQVFSLYRNTHSSSQQKDLSLLIFSRGIHPFTTCMKRPFLEFRPL